MICNERRNGSDWQGLGDKWFFIYPKQNKTKQTKSLDLDC